MLTSIVLAQATSQVLATSPALILAIAQATLLALTQAFALILYLHVSSWRNAKILPLGRNWVVYLICTRHSG